MLNTEVFIKRNILYIRFDGELDQKNVEGLRFKIIELIEKYLAPYFGFNQLTMVTEWHKNKKMPDNEYHEFVYNDALNIDKYFDYGFTKTVSSDEGSEDRTVGIRARVYKTKWHRIFGGRLAE